MDQDKKEKSLEQYYGIYKKSSTGLFIVLLIAIYFGIMYFVATRGSEDLYIYLGIPVFIIDSIASVWIVRRLSTTIELSKEKVIFKGWFRTREINIREIIRFLRLNPTGRNKNTLYVLEYRDTKGIMQKEKFDHMSMKENDMRKLLKGLKGLLPNDFCRAQARKKFKESCSEGQLLSCLSSIFLYF